MPSIPTNLARLLKATPPAVSFAPGSVFFTRRLTLPGEVQVSELDGFVELSLEGLSPFPTDQLFYGYVAAEGGGAVFVYAAYRRRFPAEVTRDWPGQSFVLPDFLPLLRRSHDQDTTVFLETADDTSVLAFRAGESLPEAVLSRPLPDTADPAARTARREALREAAGRRGLLFDHQVCFSGRWVVQENTSGLTFQMASAQNGTESGGVHHGSGDVDAAVSCRESTSERPKRLGRLHQTNERVEIPESEPEDRPDSVPFEFAQTTPTETQAQSEASGEPVSGIETEVESDDVKASVLSDSPPPRPDYVETVSFSDLWAMDIRDPEFLAGRKQAVRIDTFMWRGVLGVAVLLVILLAGEFLLVGGKISLGIIANLTTRRQGEVERIEERQKIVERLAEFDRSNLIPFEMLRAINTARPRTVYFTRAATEGLSSLIIDAATKNVADVNQYEAALRATPEVLEVEVRNLKPRDDGTTFTLVVTFRPGAFENAAGGVKTASR
ncbi:MAG: hypothetical protein R3F07_15185 [Opitutaceae bacterium]